MHPFIYDSVYVDEYKQLCASPIDAQILDI